MCAQNLRRWRLARPVAPRSMVIWDGRGYLNRVVLEVSSAGRFTFPGSEPFRGGAPSQAMSSPPSLSARHRPRLLHTA
jgi:hypothetical protein